MSNIYEQRELKAKASGEHYLVKFFYEGDEALDPMDDWDHLGTYYCFHKDYKLGDKHDYTTDEVRDIAENGNKDLLMAMPIQAYEHGGISLSLTSGYPYNDRWDSYCVGVLIITKDEARAWGFTGDDWRERVAEDSAAFIEDYNKYLNGKVYGYILEKIEAIDLYTKSEDGYKHYSTRWENKTIDRMGGFYGKDDWREYVVEDIGDFEEVAG